MAFEVIQEEVYRENILIREKGPTVVVLLTCVKSFAKPEYYQGFMVPRSSPEARLSL